MKYANVFVSGIMRYKENTGSMIGSSLSLAALFINRSDQTLSRERRDQRSHRSMDEKNDESSRAESLSEQLAKKVARLEAISSSFNHDPEEALFKALQDKLLYEQLKQRLQQAAIKAGLFDEQDESLNKQIEQAAIKAGLSDEQDESLNKQIEQKVEFKEIDEFSSFLKLKELEQELEVEIPRYTSLEEAQAEIHRLGVEFPCFKGSAEFWYGFIERRTKELSNLSEEEKQAYWTYRVEWCRNAAIRRAELFQS